MAALPMILTVAAMFRDHVVLNAGGSVPVSFYIAVDPADAEYVTFRLPPLPLEVRFDPVLCGPANPNGRPVIKRVTRVMDGAVYFRGKFLFVLNSDLFSDSYVFDGDSWVDKIRLPDFPNNVWLRHRLWTSQREAAGMVDLIICPGSADDRQLLESTAPKEAIVGPYGSEEQGVLVSFRVPEMRQSSGFGETAATRAFTAMDRLSGYFLRLARR